MSPPGAWLDWSFSAAVTETAVRAKAAIVKPNFIPVVLLLPEAAGIALKVNTATPVLRSPSDFPCFYNPRQYARQKEGALTRRALLPDIEAV